MIISHFAFRVLRNAKLFLLLNMRKHNGMRPQDIVILLKIISLDDQNWQFQDLAKSLYISNSDVFEALNRNKIAGLIDYNRKRVNRLSLLEFLEHGFSYVFPQEPGAMVKGIPTAHSHPFMQQQIMSENHYVWPDIDGSTRGQAIEPLYLNQIKAVKEDDLLYKLLSLTDILRVGRSREINIAVKELKKLILNEQPSA